MKKALFILFFALICAAAAALLPPAVEYSYMFHLPYSEEQELCIAWNNAGAARPAPVQDPDLSVMEKFFSVEFYDAPGAEARFLFYIGIHNYTYTGGRAWQRLIIEYYPNYDTSGVNVSILF